jgi:hypothetical protein
MQQQTPHDEMKGIHDQLDAIALQLTTSPTQTIPKAKQHRRVNPSRALMTYALKTEHRKHTDASRP